MRNYFRIVLILALAAVVRGQTRPPQAFIIVAKTSFVWGESNPLQMRVVNSQGVSTTVQSPSWYVDPPGAATVDSMGNVIPSRLQTIVVRGTDSGLTAEISLQILPKKITVVPERSVMTVGSSQSLRAEALDINDHPIPNINFTWRLQNLNGYFDNNYPMARVDPAGKLTSLVEGRLRAIAALPYASDRWLPTFLNEATGETQIDMQVQRTYTFERVLDAKPMSSTSSLSPKAAALLATEDDGFVFSASLNSYTSSLLEWKAGKVTPLLSAGRSHSSTHQPLIEISGYARNHNGEMLTAEQDAQGSTQVSSGPAAAQLPLLVPGTPLSVAERTWNYSVRRNSIADSGYKAVLVDYQDAVTHEGTSGLFRGSSRGVEELIVSKLDGLPGRPDSGFWFDSWGVTDDGTVWFSTNDPSNKQALWKKNSGIGSIEKVLASGDTVQGAQVNNFGIPFISSNGEVVMPVYTKNNACYFRWSAGVANPQSICGISVFYEGVYWNEAGVGALLRTNYNNQGDGLYLWNKDTVTPLLRFGDKADNSPITEIYSATANSHGVAFAMVATADSGLLIMRIRPDRQIVLREDDTVAIQLPPAIAGFVPGRGSSLSRVVVGGLTGSVAEIQPDGSLKVLVAMGDRLPTGSRYRGSRTDAWGGGQIRSIADGSLIFTDQSGIYRWRNGTIETVFAFPFTSGGAQYYSPWNMDANASGQIAAQIYVNGNSVYRMSNGVITLAVAHGANVDGETVEDVASPVIDDAGRIAFKFSNGDGNWNLVGLWDGTRVTKIAYPNMLMPDGRAITNLSQLVATADGFIASVGLTDGSTLIRYRNGAWEYIMKRNEPMATGSVPQWIDSRWGLNGPGDVSFVSNSHLEAKRGTVYHEIQDLGTATDDDEFLLAISDLHMNDDGSVFALASTDADQQVVYRGKPGVPPSPAVESRAFTLSVRGSLSTNTTGRSADLFTGFARIQPDAGKNTPAGLAIFGLRKDRVLVTEAGVPAVAAARSGRFYAEMGGAVKTGVAIANPSIEVAVIQYYVTDESGAVTKSGSLTLGAKSQIAEFLDGPDFGISSVRGAFTFTSSVGVGVTALRGYTNAENNFLITTLPVADLSPITGNQYLPHYAIGGGWSTQLILVNPTNNELKGTSTFYFEGKALDSFQYSIPPRSMKRYVPDNSSPTLQSGFVLVAPADGSTAPSSLAVFSLSSSTTVVSEAGVSGSPVGNAFRMYAEMSGSFATGEQGAISTGIAIVNTTSAPATVSVELIKADGVSTGLTGTLVLPANGRASTFLHQIPGLEKVPLPFTGIVRLTSNAAISVLGLRGRYNEVSTFLFTTLPAIPEGLTTQGELLFPHLADGSGYTTQFILMDTGSAGSGSLKFFNPQGQPLAIRLQ